MKKTRNGRTMAILLTMIVGTGSVLALGPGIKLAHDAVERVTTGSNSFHNTFRPKLYVKHGCQPFSAVDDDGNYNGGLKDAGAHDGNCDVSPSGISYSRALCREGICGIMYVYYFPKDNGVPFPSLGHRHDFEEIIVWTENDQVIGASYSAHGDYYYDENPTFSEGHVNAVYQVDGVTHSMGKISSGEAGLGEVHPNAQWGQLTSEAKQALNDTSNFPTSVFAARNDNFKDKLNEGRIPYVINAGIDFHLPVGITASGTIGGSGGSAFNNGSYLPNSPEVYKIGFRSGGRVDQVNIEYTDGTYLSNGGSGGSGHSLTLNSGEFVQSARICKGRKNGGDRVFYVKITTSDNRTLSGGKSTSSCATYTAPIGKKIVGWHGRSGGEVDRLGVLYGDTN